MSRLSNCYIVLNKVSTSSLQSAQIVWKSHASSCYLATAKLRQKFSRRTSNLSVEGFCTKPLKIHYSRL